MSVVTVADYREILEDQTTPDATIQTRLDRAEARISEFLKRPLALGTYTESLPADDSWSVLHPTATPVTSVSSPVNAVIVDNVSVISNGFWPWDMITEHEWDPLCRTRYRVSVTYVGGWDNTTIPIGLKEAIALVASRLGAAASAVLTQVPVGAIAVKLGDASITFASPVGSGGTLESLVPGIGASLRKYRYPY